MDLFIRYKSISVYKSAAERIYPLAALLSCKSELAAAELCADVFRAVAESGSDTTGEWICKLLYVDDNVFSRTVARGERISDRLKAQVSAELDTFKKLSLIKPDGFLTEENKSYFPRFGFGGMSATYERLLAFYLENGYGASASGSSFLFRDGALRAQNDDGAALSDLKSYAEEKAELVRNTQNFIAGRPSFHALLYGDRGTGKTATVRAIAREYRDKLKIAELAAADIPHIPELIQSLKGLLQKYILFIDGLENMRECDAVVLERALDAPVGNVLIYCTADATGDAEKKPTEYGLFDRFGLVVTYVTPEKDGFCDILKQIIRSRGIKWHDEYAAVAELAALKNGGRTPRAARQIADLIESNYAERLGV